MKWWRNIDFDQNVWWHYVIRRVKRGIFIGLLFSIAFVGIELLLSHHVENKLYQSGALLVLVIGQTGVMFKISGKRSINLDHMRLARRIVHRLKLLPRVDPALRAKFEAIRRSFQREQDILDYFPMAVAVAGSFASAFAYIGGVGFALSILLLTLCSIALGITVSLRHDNPEVLLELEELERWLDDHASQPPSSPLRTQTSA